MVGIHDICKIVINLDGQRQAYIDIPQNVLLIKLPINLNHYTKQNNRADADQRWACSQRSIPFCRLAPVQVRDATDLHNAMLQP